ncbi:hypothetical protein AAVH_11439 [Aphelenchoides avenae]|nr:hypothetical protein AAVH_11439 [Aphelenchus avenae]
MNRSLSASARVLGRTLTAASRRCQTGFGSTIEGPPLHRHPPAPPNPNPTATKAELGPKPPREKNAKKKREEIEKIVEKQRDKDEQSGKDPSGMIFPGGES